HAEKNVLEVLGVGGALLRVGAQELKRDIAGDRLEAFSDAAGRHDLPRQGELGRRNRRWRRGGWSGGLLGLGGSGLLRERRRARQSGKHADEANSREGAVEKTMGHEILPRWTPERGCQDGPL